MNRLFILIPTTFLLYFITYIIVSRVLYLLLVNVPLMEVDWVCEGVEAKKEGLLWLLTWRRHTVSSVNRGI